MHTLIIADDLTGALDSAATLAEVGLRCRVARRPSGIAAALATDPEVLAVNTATREGEKAAAAETISRVLDATAEAAPALVFKKVDSRLKGHVVAELRVTAERAGHTRALVAPAIPGQGRITEGGRLVGSGVAEPIDVLAAFATSGLTLSVPDTRSDADLDRVLAEALDEPLTVLVGAAGLAAALGRRLRPGRRGVLVDRIPAPLLIAIGSRDPITLAQVEAASAAGSVIMLPAPGGVPSLQTSAATADALLVQLAQGYRELDPKVAGARFARSVAALLCSGGTRTLLGCGGETADAILDELSVGVLEVKGQLLPGVPVSSMVVNGRPMHLITKSGGFGEIGTLVSVVEAASRGDGT